MTVSFHVSSLESAAIFVMYVFVRMFGPGLSFSVVFGIGRLKLFWKVLKVQLSTYSPPFT